MVGRLQRCVSIDIFCLTHQNCRTSCLQYFRTDMTFKKRAWADYASEIPVLLRVSTSGALRLLVSILIFKNNILKIDKATFKEDIKLSFSSIIIATPNIQIDGSDRLQRTINVDIPSYILRRQISC